MHSFLWLCNISLCMYTTTLLSIGLPVDIYGMLSFKPAFSPSSFTFIKSLFNSSSLSAIRVVSFAYLRLLIFLPQSWFQFVLHQADLWFFFTFCDKGGIICISEVIDIFLAILIPIWASSSQAFLMMYSAYKLNNRVTIYSLDVLLSQSVTSLLFHVQF